MKVLKALTIGVAAATMMFASSARAAFDFDGFTLTQESEAIPGNSWLVNWSLVSWGLSFDRITGTIVSGLDRFEAPAGITAFTPGWTSTTGPLHSEISSGAPVTSLFFTTHFTGHSWDTPPITLLLQAYSGVNVIATSPYLQWDGHEWDVVPAPVIPEPTTVIAGALLLLPFGASTLRIVRKRHSATL